MRFTDAMTASDAGADVTDRLAAVRAALAGDGLRRRDLLDDPIAQLQAWWDHAVGVGVPEPEAMALATADVAARPSVRFVLLRGLDERGAVFFTNHRSRKGRELDVNPYAAGVMAWHAIGRQARVSGPVERVSPEEADLYWSSRARGSQLAACASPQSAEIADRAGLERLFATEEERWAGRPVERPEHWGGYRIVPEEVELWQGRRDRFHDRFRYARVAPGRWAIARLAP